MIDAGLVAVIIKVAGIGLTEKHLGKTLAEMQPILMKLVRVLCCIQGIQRDLCEIERIIWVAYLW